MNSKHLQQFLILLVIFLVCSITPASAVQNSDIQSNSDNINLFNETYIEDMTKLLKSFDEATNTELTPEQDTYLETHKPILLSKAETILYNLQQFLNILLMEYYIENTTRRSNEGNKEDSLETVKSLDKYNGTELWCTFEELNKGKGVKPGKINERVEFNNEHVIMHVKDPKYGYMEFVGFISIDDKTIKYQKGTNIIDYPLENFTAEYPPTKGKNTTANNTRYSITTFNCSTQLALECMYVEKEDKLIDRRSNLDIGRWICGIFAGVGGMAVAVAGTYRLCDYCNTKHGKESQKL